MLKRVTVIKTRVNKGNGDSIGDGKVKSMTDTTEVTYVVIACARKGGNLFGKREVRVKDESEVTSRRSGRNGMCGSEGK